MLRSMRASPFLGLPPPPLPSAARATLRVEGGRSRPWAPPLLTPSPHLGGRSSWTLRGSSLGAYGLESGAGAVYFVKKCRGDFRFALGSDVYELREFISIFFRYLIWQ